MTRTPLLVVLLAGCAAEVCPPLSELEVTDPDGVASELEMALAIEAVDQFAQWTGRETICVDELRFVPAELEGEQTLVDRHPRIPGDRMTIDAGRGTDTTRGVKWRLCRALDDVEDLSDTHVAELMAVEPEMSAASSFAWACSSWDRSTTLTRTVRDECGTTSSDERQEVADWIASDVYPEGPDPVIHRVAWTPEWTEIAVPPVPVEAVRTFPGGLVVLQRGNDWLDKAEVAFVSLDPVELSSRVQVDLGTNDDYAYVQLVPTDRGALVLYESYPDRRSWLVPEGGKSEEVGLQDAESGAAIWEDLMYWTERGDVGTAEVRVTDVRTGADVDVDFGLDTSGVGFIDVHAGGIWMFAADGVSVGRPDSGWQHTYDGSFPLGAGRYLNREVVGDQQQAFYVSEPDGSVTLPIEPCFGPVWREITDTGVILYQVGWSEGTLAVATVGL
jgi:hypothetical protein